MFVTGGHLGYPCLHDVLLGAFLRKLIDFTRLLLFFFRNKITYSWVYEYVGTYNYCVN